MSYLLIIIYLLFRTILFKLASNWCTSSVSYKYREIPIIRPPMVLIESGINNEQVSLMRPICTENCISVLKQVVLLGSVVLISNVVYSINIHRLQQIIVSIFIFISDMESRVRRIPWNICTLSKCNLRHGLCSQLTLPFEHVHVSHPSLAGNVDPDGIFLPSSSHAEIKLCMKMWKQESAKKN